MMVGDILSGRQTTWTLMKKLGEGDAGEVYLVESQADRRRAILKRPANSPFSGDIARQSAQIETEGKILAALNPLFAGQPEAGFTVPALLDSSPPGTEGSERLFIVIEQAAGIDLGSLARLGALGFEEPAAFAGQLSPVEAHFLNALNSSGKVPERILILVLQRLIALLEQAHTHALEIDGTGWSGILWNDVKPDHLFWNPRCARLMVIDWGNGQLLEADGATPDRRYSTLDDYRQLVEEMGRLLALAAPALKHRLAWPERFSPGSGDSAEALAALKEKLEEALQEANQAQAELRRREVELLRPAPPTEDPLPLLEDLHRQIIAGGELPDYAGALAFCQAYAMQLAEEEQLETLRQVSDWAARLPDADQDAWRILGRIAQIAGRSEGAPRRSFIEAAQAAAGGEWENVMWGLVAAIHSAPEPDWWYDLSTQVRRRQLEPDAEAITPLVSIKRTLLTLQSLARQIEDRRSNLRATLKSSAIQAQLDIIQSLAQRLQEEIIPNWRRPDPAPPHAGLVYSDIDAFLREIAALLPEAQQSIDRALAQPRTQVGQVLEAWNRKDFTLAGYGLRRLLMFDPDRQRILRAGNALAAAQAWLKRAQLGPLRGESMLDFATILEFEGRELRNQVGPAAWLDRLLESCKKLRQGVWPVELASAAPELLSEMPWIQKFERGERFAVLEEPGAPPAAPPPVLSGVLEGRLGKDQDMLLKSPLDTWTPEARGSSARVYLGALHNASGKPHAAALKLMRMNKIEYALPLFREEVQVLSILHDVPGVNRMLECGFIHLDDDADLPVDSAHDSAHHLTGDVLRLGVDQAQTFVDELPARVKDGWTPYLAVEKRRQKDNLLRFCDAGSTHGRFLPLTDLLRMSVQICDILQSAHERNIVYRDHKILHYYWQNEDNAIYTIDWNVARLHPDGLSEIEIHMDLVQFGARALHHILTGRTAPGALPMGPTRPEEIEAAEQSYSVQWTYDDQRLSQELKEILERALAGRYTSAAGLAGDLKHAYLQIKNGENGSAGSHR